MPSRRKGLLWPGHKYLGPGNPLDDAQPIDADDAVAKVHDEAYQKNQDRKSVRSADEAAIDSFIRIGNVHSIFGAIGLGAKKTWEDTFGQVYPAMPRKKIGSTSKPHAGRQRYGEVARGLNDDWKAQGRPGTWNEFIKRNWRTHWHKVGGAPIPTESSSTKEIHGPGSTTTNRPSNKRHADDAAEAGPSKQRAEHPIDEDIRAIQSHNWDDTPPHPAMHNMDVDTPEASGNPSQGADSGNLGSAGRSGGGRSGATGSSQTIEIYKTPKTEYYTKAYRKSWVFFSYGFAHTKQALKNIATEYYTTPLLLIPVDLLAFYMDDTEFQLLYGRCVAVSCRAQVRTLGCRMNFQVNASTSGWATSEFVAIGQTSVGLNLAIPIENRQMTPSATKPMVPESTSSIDMDILDEKLYGSIGGYQGCAQMVPRHLNMYACAATPTNETANLTGKRFNNNYGPPKFDQYIERFLVNSAIGQPLVDYEYKIKEGTLCDQYHSIYINEDKRQFITAPSIEKTINDPVPTDPAVPNTVAQGEMQQTTSGNYITGWENELLSRRYQNLEVTRGYDWHKGGIHGNVQPQVHVGLTAVPSINPANDNVDFQNTTCYWAVDCELLVHHYQNSQAHYNNPMTYHPEFYGPEIKKYSSGLAFNHHLDLNADRFYTDKGTLKGTKQPDKPVIRLSSGTGFRPPPAKKHM